MMLCPKEMDQTTLIQTLVRQITSDPSSRGRKTIRITQTKKTVSRVGRVGGCDEGCNSGCAFAGVEHGQTSESDPRTEGDGDSAREEAR